MGTLKTNSGKAQFYGIDIVKFFLAILVVAGHTYPLKIVTNPDILTIYSAATEQVVPFFFISSSFFLFSKFEADLYSDTNIKLLKKAGIRFLKLYLLWHLIYLPITICGFLRSDDSIVKSIFLFIRNLLFVGDQWLSWPLWYLLSTIYATFYVTLLLKWKVKENWIYFSAFIVFAGASFLSSFVSDSESYAGVTAFIASLIKKTIVNGRCFSGIGIFTFGMFLARNKSRIPTLPKPVCFLLWLSAVILYCLSSSITLFLLSEILIIISSFLLFLLAKSFYGVVQSKAALFCRKSSTVLYFTHMIWYFVGGILFYGFDRVSSYGFFPFAWVLSLSILTAAITNRYSHHRIIKLLFY